MESEVGACEAAAHTFWRCCVLLLLMMMQAAAAAAAAAVAHDAFTALHLCRHDLVHITPSTHLLM